MCKMTDLERADARVRLLEGKLAERDAEVKTMLATLRQAHYYLKEYSDDANNATHAKRVISNAIHALTPTTEEESSE